MGNALRLSEARELTPAPDGIGSFAATLRAAAEQAFAPAAVAEMLSAVMDKAKRGDLAAVRFVADMMAPPPPPKVEVKKLVVHRGKRSPRRAKAEAGGGEDAADPDRIAGNQRAAVVAALARLGPCASVADLSDECVLPPDVVRKRLREVRG